MQAVEKLHNLEARQLKVFKGDQLIALLPVYEKKLLGYKGLACPAGSYYQGLNLWLEDSSPAPRKLLDTLQITQTLAEYLKSHYHRIQLNLSPETQDIRGFTWSMLKAKPLYTFVSATEVQLKPLPDERKKINLAVSKGYEFSWELDLDAFFALFKAMNARKQRSLGFTYPGFRLFLEELSQAGIMRQGNLEKNGKIISSNILLKDGNKAYTVFRATDNEALKTGASSLHSLRLLEYAKAEGITDMDFCGGNVKEVARFKAALGLELKPFYQINN